MNDRTKSAVRTLALGRLGIGIAALALPGVVGRAWIGSSGGGRGVKALVRAFGARDAVIAVGTLIALDDNRPVSHWLWFGAAVDAVDAAATVLAFGNIPTRSLVSVAAMAGAGAATQIRLAQQAEAEIDAVPESV
ncbi:MAG: hypothetical protein ACRDWD_07620 [Acidimicrobiia bacterium]